jgi:hypothetical protein
MFALHQNPVVVEELKQPPWRRNAKLRIQN